MTEPGTCAQCRYYEPKRERCRFNSPTVLVVGGVPETAWPSTHPDDWCGEWAAPRTAKQAGAGW